MTEQISALLDDEIELADAEHLLVGMQPSSQLAEAWSQYHLIGDVMRGASPLSTNFKQNLMAKIDLEPTVLSPNAAWMESATKHNVESLAVKNKFPVKMPMAWSIAASFAAVVVVGWMVLQTQVKTPATPELVATSTMPQTQDAPTIAVATEQTIPAEYLMAHQASAPSASSYYIQPASYTQ